MPLWLQVAVAIGLLAGSVDAGHDHKAPPRSKLVPPPQPKFVTPPQSEVKLETPNVVTPQLEAKPPPLEPPPAIAFYYMENQMAALATLQMTPDEIVNTIRGFQEAVGDRNGWVPILAYRQFFYRKDVIEKLLINFPRRPLPVRLPNFDQKLPTDPNLLYELFLMGLRFDMGQYMLRFPRDRDVINLSHVMPYLENRDLRVAVNILMKLGRSAEVGHLLVIKWMCEQLNNTSAGLYAALDALDHNEPLAFEALVQHRSASKWINKKIWIYQDTLLHIAVRRNKLWAIPGLCKAPGIDLHAVNVDYEQAMDLVEPDSIIYNVILHWMEVKNRRNVEVKVGVPPSESLGQDAINAARNNPELLQAMFANPDRHEETATSPIVSGDSDSERIQPYYAPDSDELSQEGEPISRPWPTDDPRNPVVDPRPPIKPEIACLPDPVFPVSFEKVRPSPKVEQPIVEPRKRLSPIRKFIRRFIRRKESSQASTSPSAYDDSTYSSDVSQMTITENEWANAKQHVYNNAGPLSDDLNTRALSSRPAKRRSPSDETVIEKFSIADTIPYYEQHRIERLGSDFGTETGIVLHGDSEPPRSDISAEELAPMHTECQNNSRFRLSRILFSLISKMSEIEPVQKGALKNLVIRQDPAIFAAADLFDAEGNMVEFKDTLIRRLQNCPWTP